MKRLLYFAISVGAVFATHGRCNAESAKCPWLNAATAAGVLGGEVELLVSGASAAPPVEASYPAADERADRVDVTCDFSRKTGDQVYRLHIAVSTLVDPVKDFPKYLAQCKSTSALIAIGNEAVQCRVSADADAALSTSEEVIARVRNRAFVLTIDRTPEMRVQTNKLELSDKTRNVAEQVAGSLF